MKQTHRAHVDELLRAAAADHADLLPRLPLELQQNLPVDAQGLTRAIDYLAAAAGLSEHERRALVRPHAINPAVLHARIFGAAQQLNRETVISSFVEGARVRADALAGLADAVGGAPLGQEVRTVLVAHPPPLVTDTEVVPALRATYEAQERAALMIAASLDG